MVSKQNVGNAFVTFSRFAALFHGLMCLVIALMLLVTGFATLGTSGKHGDASYARVMGVECDSRGTVCAIAVGLPCGRQTTFQTSNAFKYSVGDDISVLVDSRGRVSERLPYRAMGWMMVAGALVVGTLAIWALKVIASSRDAAATFGGLSVMGLLFR